MNKNTVKYKVLKRVSTDVKNPTSRMDLQRFIWEAQGNDPKDFKYRQGYYCDGIQEWNHGKLIKRIDKGLYVLGEYGKMFVDNPRLIKLINKAVKYDGMKSQRDRFIDAFYENRDLKWKLRNINEQIVKLINL